MNKRRKESVNTEIKNIDQLVIREDDIKPSKELEKLSKISLLDYQSKLHITYCNKCPIRCDSHAEKSNFCMSKCDVGKSIGSVGKLILSGRKAKKK